MISKATIKYIHSLEHKKYRMLEGVFLVEGHKSIRDMLLAGWKPRTLEMDKEKAWASITGKETQDAD